jgi:hypothetical protein
MDLRWRSPCHTDGPKTAEERPLAAHAIPEIAAAAASAAGALPDIPGV